MVFASCLRQLPSKLTSGRSVATPPRPTLSAMRPWLLSDGASYSEDWGAPSAIALPANPAWLTIESPDARDAAASNIVSGRQPNA